MTAAGLAAAGLAQDAPIVLTGLAAALCLMVTPLFRSRRTILLAQLAAGICFAAHYACLGITAAAAANVLGIVQILAALFSVRSAAMNRLGYALICLMVLVGLWFWQGPISALSVTATALIALARMQSDELRLRLLLLAGSGFWTMHDLVGEAWIVLAADIGTVLFGVAVLFSRRVRVDDQRRPPSARPTPTKAGERNPDVPGEHVALSIGRLDAERRHASLRLATCLRRSVAHESRRPVRRQGDRRRLPAGVAGALLEHDRVTPKPCDA